MDPSMLDPVCVAELLIGAATVDGTATDEQRSVIGALLDGLLDANVDLAAVAPMEPDGFDPEALGAPDDETRRLVGHMMAMVVMCRDPLTIAQIDRADAIARSDDGATSEVTDARVYEIVSSWRDLPEGTLGRAFVAFYERFGFDLPGAPGATGVHRPASWRVYHDMAHVIADYGTSGVGELAVTAMMYAINRDDDRWAGLMNAFAVYEAGMTPGVAFGFVGKQAALARPGATAVLADALKRGRHCTGDFSRAHFAALAPLPIEEVRARFGVLPVRTTFVT